MTLLKHLPPNSGMAFVVVQHLDPRHASRLSDLLSKVAPIPVEPIRDRVTVKPNRVYVIPPNFNVILSHGAVLRLVPRPPGERIHMAIDHFFKSLARERGPGAIGVIFSGTGSDGTQGLGAVKSAGGLTFAEGEESARYFAMPQNAIAAGFVDAIVTPRRLAAELAKISKHPYVRRLASHAETELSGEAQAPEERDGLLKICALLRKRKRVDFSSYKPSTLQRRLARRMALLRIEHVSKYVDLLRRNSAELDALFDDILINVTGFFRDKQVFQALEKKVIPQIIKSSREGGEIRLWVPGCATGEEVYSLAILFVEALDKAEATIRLRVFATDLSENILARARLGVYPDSIRKEVSPGRLRRFFDKVDGGYQVCRAIRQVCTYAQQNIYEDPPFSRLDLISCRNVLIYLGPETQKKCIPIFHYALKPGGFLVLGTSETVGGFADLFSLTERRHKIYVKKVTRLRPALDFSTRFNARPPVSNQKPPQPARGEDISEVLERRVDKIILNDFCPAAVVVDQQMQALLFRGKTSRFLEHVPGRASLNLLQMVDPGLGVDLRAAFYQAAKQKRALRKEATVIDRNRRLRVLIRVIPFKIDHTSQHWYLVLFEEAGLRASGEGPAKGTMNRRHRPDKGEIQKLREELDSTRQSLQAIIEEQDATNEELKSANEEVQSSNEEFQSTNEELETAKEELQSTNEELTTVNEELANRNAELATLNDDLNNLLTSTTIPMIFVDARLAIRRFTAPAAALFRLFPGDVGSSLSTLESRFNLKGMNRVIRKVIDTLANEDQEVRDAKGRWYSLRVRPYRTADGKIAGAVVILIDVDDLKRLAELEARQAEIEQKQHLQDLREREFAEAVIDTVQEPILVLDGRLRIRAASKAFCRVFNCRASGMKNRPLMSLDGGEWDLPQLRHLLERVLPKRKRFDHFQIDLPVRGALRRKFFLNARRLVDAGEPLIFLSATEAPDHAGFREQRDEARRR